MANPKHEQMDYKGLELLVDNIIFVDANGDQVSLRDVLDDVETRLVDIETAP